MKNVLTSITLTASRFAIIQDSAPRYLINMAERSPSRAEASTSGSAGYIEHTVSKLDTLAGVAIKYGVEVF